MKKLVFPLIVVALLFWIFADKCNSNVNETAFQTKQDSIQRIVDSLEISISKKDSTVDSLNIVTDSLLDKVTHQKIKIVSIVKYVDSGKVKIDNFTEQQLVSHFNQRYPKDTTTNLLPLAQPVLVSAAKELVELDGTKQIIVVKDSIISLNESIIVNKDATINLFKSKESDYKFIVSMKDEQIKDYKVHYEMLKLENNKLKIKNKFTKIGAGIIIGGLTYLLIK